MKRVLLASILVAAILVAPTTAQAKSGEVVGCSKISVDRTVTKGVSLPCLDNKSKVIYQAIRGPVIVNVFGSWCEPCNQEIPHFLDLQALHKISIVGIDVEETSMKAGRNFVIKKGMSWPILFDTTSVTRGIFGLGVPVTWFIDAHGKVVYKQIGLITSTAELKSEVTKYLKVKL
jgi:cytochrome c biogenesis protein CcmG, thiol:disulfide interchange protein DsbE